MVSRLGDCGGKIKVGETKGGLRKGCRDWPASEVAWDASAATANRPQCTVAPA